jgi:hypothetical protein
LLRITWCGHQMIKVSGRIRFSSSHRMCQYYSTYNIFRTIQHIVFLTKECTVLDQWVLATRNLNISLRAWTTRRCNYSADKCRDFSALLNVATHQLAPTSPAESSVLLYKWLRDSFISQGWSRILRHRSTDSKPVLTKMCTLDRHSFTGRTSNQSRTIEIHLFSASTLVGVTQRQKYYWVTSSQNTHRSGKSVSGLLQETMRKRNAYIILV